MATDYLSATRIKLFKACRRAYELKYIEGLEPVTTADSLKIGATYHAKLEQLYKEGDFDQDFSRESAMATAYKKYIYPKFAVKASEEWQRYKLQNGEVMLGRVDGIATDGNLVEHKTTSLSPDEYEYNLQWDEQILTYMLMTGARNVWYTICRKPTIRQKKNETEEEFYDRMVAWYDEDTDSKLAVYLLNRTDADVEEYRQSLEKIATEIAHCDDFYRNTCHCNAWGRRCEYASVCLHYDPEQEYVEFVRRESD